MKNFIIVLYEMTQNCDCNSKEKDERIRDQLVIGLADKDLSEKIQLRSNLTLDDAVQISRHSELVRSHKGNQKQPLKR